MEYERLEAEARAIARAEILDDRERANRLLRWAHSLSGDQAAMFRAALDIRDAERRAADSEVAIAYYRSLMTGE